MTDLDLKETCKHSFKNRAQIEMSIKCGCFYCLRIFKADSITEWTDQCNTAICPFCGIDSVIGDSVELTERLLHDLKSYAFAEYW